MIIAGFLGKWGETDGVVTTYSNLLRNLTDRHRNIDILVYGPADDVDQIGNVRVITHKPRLPVKIDPARWVDLAVFASPSLRCLSRIPYDLVQSSTPDPLGLFGLSVARKSRCPLVLVFHTALHEYARIRFSGIAGRQLGNLAGKGMAAWLRWYYNKADLVLTPSISVKRYLEGMLKPRVAVLTRGVDTERFHPGLRTRTHGPVRAVYVGRVAPEKGLHLLVDIFSEMADVELMIVGDGPYLRQLKRHLPKAVFTGRLTGAALSQAYANADLFVFPSKTDTLGNVVLEAMSSGLPVVVSNVGGPKELVNHGKTGLVAESDEAFAGAVTRLTRNPNLRHQMARAARTAAEHRRWQDIADKMIAYHDAVMARHRLAQKTVSETPHTAHIP